MSDVSFKVIVDLVDYAKSRGFDRDKILAGVSDFATSPGVNFEKSQFVPWSVFVKICQNISDANGGESWAADFARFATEMRAKQILLLSKISRFVAGPKWLYWAVNKWVAPDNFRNVTFHYEDLGKNQLRLKMELSRQCQDFPYFFLSGRYNLESVPRVMGLPNAIVTLELSPWCGVYTVQLPPSVSFWSRILRALKVIFSSRFVIDEMAGQDRMLEKNYRELLASQAELNVVRMTLEQRVSERTSELQEKIVALQAAETEKKNTEQRYRQIVQTAPCVIWALGLDGCFTLVNEQILSIFGFQPDEVLGKHFSEFIPENDLENVEKAFKLVLNGETLRNFEFQIKTKDDRVLDNYTNAKPLLNDSGKIVGVTGTTVDITDAKVIDNKIRENEARLIKAQEIARFGYWTWNIVANKITWSDQVYRIFGREPQSFTVSYDLFKTFLHPDDRKTVDDAVVESLNKNVPYRVEHRIVLPDGRIRYLLERAETIFNQSGEPVEMIGTIQDVTERKNYERQLIEAKEAADAANRAKSAFLANMSHELRTPLGAMIGFADLLSNRTNSDQDRTLFTDIILRNGKHLVELIDDILDVSKIEARRLEVTMEAFSPVLLINQVAELLMAEAAKKSLKLNLHGIEDLPKLVVSDKTKIRQILMNIIGNAIKFTSRGSVDVFCSMERKNLGDYLNFRVVDSGKGISPSNIDHLFAPFTQEDVSTTREFGGTGLGLYLSRKLANLLGGDVCLIDSEENKGSVFQITIRAGSAETKQSVPKWDSEEFRENATRFDSLREKHLLLVEDHPDNQLMIKTMLERARCVVDVASTGSEGLGKATSFNYDAILMDMQLPEIDGFNLTRQLRGRSLEVPIIALTAFASREDRERCLAAGCNDFLSKPLQESKLFDVIIKWLP